MTFSVKSARFKEQDGVWAWTGSGSIQNRELLNSTCSMVGCAVAFGCTTSLPPLSSVASNDTVSLLPVALQPAIVGLSPQEAEC